jgi:hypothetical protein
MRFIDKNYILKKKNILVCLIFCKPQLGTRKTRFLRKSCVEEKHRTGSYKFTCKYKVSYLISNARLIIENLAITFVPIGELSDILFL